MSPSSSTLELRHRPFAQLHPSPWESLPALCGLNSDDGDIYSGSTKTGVYCICPFSSPALASLFFVLKNDGAVHPCIDYRGINAIMVQVSHVRTAAWCTVLYQAGSADNLVHIREEDKWKTAFSMTSRHYQYRVMPYRLVNTSSVFQAFINDVLRDILGRYDIAYIDDILVYSACMSAHGKHVCQVLLRLMKHRLYVKAEKSVSSDLHLLPGISDQLRRSKNLRRTR